MANVNVSERIIGILNEDERACIALEEFNSAVERQGLTIEEAAESRKMLMSLLIAHNPEAMDVMARAAYEEFRA